MTSTLTLVSPSQLDTHDPNPCTEESINAAKLACLRERADIYRATGIRIGDDGRITRIDQDPFWSMQRLADMFCAAIYGPRGEWRR